MMSERKPMPTIVGIGKCVGEYCVTNSDFDTAFNKPVGYFDRIMALSNIGIQTRFWAEIGQPFSDLGSRALIEAMCHAGINQQKVGALFVATSSPDHLASNISATVAKKAGLRKDILGSVNVDACPGSLFALHRAITALSSQYGGADTVAVVAGDIVSTFLPEDMSDNNTMKISCLFGDAAAGIILENVIPESEELRIMGFAWNLDGDFATDLGIFHSGSDSPNDIDLLSCGVHPLYMNGKVIYEQAVKRMPEVLGQALDNAHVPKEEIDWFIFHQANLKIMQDAADAANIPWEKCIVTINSLGNTSAASIPTALDIAIKDGRIKNTHKLGLVAFGAGLSTAALVTSVFKLPQ